MRASITLPLLTIAALLAAPSALASGSGGGGGTYPSASSDPLAEAYSRGKSLVKKRITCKKCAYPAGVQDTPTAQKVASRVRAGEFDLKPEDRQKVLYYLQRRFAA